MPTLLHLDSSANTTDESVSRALTGRFAASWRARHGDGGYRYRDLVRDPVPPIGAAYCALGRRVERLGGTDVAAVVANGDEAREWRLTAPLIAEVLAADTVLIGAPMYNFAVPAALKAWIDRITFPGAFVPLDTGEKLLRDTRIVAVCPRGGSYAPGTPRAASEFQAAYLRAYFTNYGVAGKNLHTVTPELTLATQVPRLAHLRPAADTSLADAHATLLDLVAHTDQPAHAVR